MTDTQYAQNFIYKNGQLQFIAQPPASARLHRVPLGSKKMLIFRQYAARRFSI